jgi:hypothetical protein
VRGKNRQRKNEETERYWQDVETSPLHSLTLFQGEQKQAKLG